MRRKTATALASACALLAPATAAASNVTVMSHDLCELEDQCQFPTSWPSVEYVAGTGEANALELAFAAGVVSVRDAGAVVAPGAACSRVSEREAACRPADVPTYTGLPEFAVTLGDGSDTLAMIAPFAFDTSVTAGAGDDAIAGGEADDAISGGAGDDRIDGGDGDDALEGGTGRDALAGGRGDDGLSDPERDDGPDRYDGGDGRDLVTYGGRRRAVTASLRDGTGAGGDVLTGVERIAGGRGDDRLTGDRHANGLYGHRGRDRLTGGAGADTLFGGSGADVLDGGRGDDTLHGEGGDRISCGPGADLVSEAQPADVLARDCEAIDLDFIDGAGKMRPNPVVRRGVARFLLPCPGTHGCRGSVHLRSAGAPTRRAFATRRRGRISVRVPLPLRAKRVRVDILVSLRGEFDEGSAAYSVRIPR